MEWRKKPTTFAQTDPDWKHLARVLIHTSSFLRGTLDWACAGNREEYIQCRSWCAGIPLGRREKGPVSPVTVAFERRWALCGRLVHTHTHCKSPLGDSGALLISLVDLRRITSSYFPEQPSGNFSKRMPVSIVFGTPALTSTYATTWDISVLGGGGGVGGRAFKNWADFSHRGPKMKWFNSSIHFLIHEVLLHYFFCHRIIRYLIHNFSTTVINFFIHSLASTWVPLQGYTQHILQIPAPSFPPPYFLGRYVSGDVLRFFHLTHLQSTHHYCSGCARAIGWPVRGRKKTSLWV